MANMGDSTPICRCRVLYLGSAVPRQSKNGLQGIQEPLRSLYPSEGAIGAKGIDSWLSVWSNGILLENVDENGKQVTRFFPIESLHYCAAVRQVLIPERGNATPEFLPLDSPFARIPKAQHPPIFAAILRRTTGIKVLECHLFICKREAAANALVRCCFHAYADNSYARQLDSESLRGGKSNGDIAGSSGSSAWRSRAGSTTTLNSVGRHSTGTGLMNGLNGNAGGHSSGGVGGGGRSNGLGTSEGYTSVNNLYASSADLNVVDDGEGSIYNGDVNHKVWNGSNEHLLDGVGSENHYEVFSGNSSTLGRPTRARQISAPIPVPPPPKEETKKKKEKRSTKYSGSQSLSGTLIRPKPVHASTLQRPGLHPPPPPASMIYGPLGPPLPTRQYHTVSHRTYAMNGGGNHHHHPHHHHAPHHGPMSGPPPPQHHHHMMPPHMAMPPPMQPMPIMVAQQFATLQHPRTTKKKKKDKMNGIVPVGMPMPPPMFAAYPPQGSPSMVGEPRPLAMSNRKLAQSVGAGLDDSGNSGGESPGGTGIYRRKGHLNERAFSYSIRQEHRSRSHGSLASLQFNPPDLKKEREIAQMVAGLELTDEQPTTLTRPRNLGNGHAIAGGAGYGPTGTFGKPRR